MSFLDRKQYILYHQGDGGGGTDVAAHRTDHFTLVKKIPELLEGKTVREKRALRPKIRRTVKDLMITASVTGGNPIEHRDVAVNQINAHLPRYLRISPKHIRFAP